MSKAVRAIITLGILLLFVFAIFSPMASMRHVPWFVLAGGASIAITYGISLLFRDELPLLRRLGTAYLAFAGVTYIIPAAIGLVEDTDFVVHSMWDGLINPYLFVWLYTHSHADQYQLPNSSFYFMPQGLNDGFSYAVMGVSVIAIVAALAMARSSRIGLGIWVVLISASVLFSGSYLYLGTHSWGMDEVGVQLWWEASYLVAFVLATWGVKWGRTDSDLA